LLVKALVDKAHDIKDTIDWTKGQGDYRDLISTLSKIKTAPLSVSTTCPKGSSLSLIYHRFLQEMKRFYLAE